MNAGVIDHPLSGVPVVAFVSRGGARKLVDLRSRPQVTVVFRSGWEWVAVEGDGSLVGPRDPADGVDEAAVMLLVRTVYAAAVGGTPEEWSQLDESMAREHHTAVLITPRRVYPTVDS